MAGSGCTFCKIVDGRLPSSQAYADEHFTAFMDIHPFRPGHVLLVPRMHAQYVHELPDELAERLFGLGTRLATAIRASSLPSDGMHFLINDGPAAFQTVPHLHLHLIPRQRGDTAQMLAQLLKRPIVALLRQAPRSRLDAQAAEIAACLERG